MLLNQSISAGQARVACASLTILLGLGGCALMRQGLHHNPAPETASAPEPAASAPADTAPAPEPQTVTEAVADVPDEPGTTTVISDAGPELKTSAPKNYVVQRGDTLWHIANLFLKDPFSWPEIWYLNPDIKNPHRIYPGDTVQLALRGDGHTAIQVVSGARATGAVRLEPMLRSTPTEGPIATIPYTAIAAFLSRPGVLTPDEIKSAPYVLAIRDDHQVAGTGHELYVKKLAGDTGARYSVMHLDQPLTDRESGRKLGYLAIYTGTAQLTAPGAVAKATLTDSARETLRGDVLVAEDRTVTSDIVPHAPSKQIKGRVMAVINGVMLAGQYDIVALNRGGKDGIERGNVLTVDQVGGRAADHCASIEGHSTCGHVFGSSVTLPSEDEGTLLVFKTYDNMSFALVLSETAPIRVDDRIRNP